MVFRLSWHFILILPIPHSLFPIPFIISMSELIELDFLDLGIASGLMVIAIGLSFWQKIGLELNLAFATVRSILQLIVLGYILDFILALNSVGAVLAILAVMLTLAAIVAKNRIAQKMPGILPLVWGSMFFSTAFTLISGVVTGITIVALCPKNEALSATPCAWLPAEAVITSEPFGNLLSL